MSRRSGWVRVVAAVALAVVAGGCSSGDGGSTTVHPESPTPSGTRSVAAVGEVATCPQGSEPDRPGPASQARPLLYERGVSAAVDAQSGMVVVVDDIGATWTFDLCTNTWTKPPVRGPAPPEWPRLVYDAVSDLTYAVGDAEILGFDVESATWSVVSTRDEELDGASGYNRVVLDPEHRTVYVYNAGNGELSSYDVVHDSWTRIAQGKVHPPVGVHGLAAFDASVGRIVLKVLYSAEGPLTDTGEPRSTPPVPVYSQTWTFDPATGTWAKVHTTTPELLLLSYFPGGEMTYDTTSRTSVAFAEGRLATFDATTGGWAVAVPNSSWPPAVLSPVAPYADVTQPDGTEQHIPITLGRLARSGHALVDDVVNHRLLVLGGMVRDADDQGEKGSELRETGSDAWAYDVAANAWTMILPAQPD